LKPKLDLTTGIEYVPAVWPFPEPIPYEAPSRKPRHPPLSARQIEEKSQLLEQMEAGLDLSRELASGREAVAEASIAQSARMLKAKVEDEDFVIANKKLANSWMSMCKRSEYDQSWLLHSEKELWVQTKIERREGRRERKMLLDKMRPMPFEDWYQNVKQESEALLAYRGIRGDEDASDQVEHSSLHTILRDMADPSKRGLVERQDREVAGQVALTALRKQMVRGSTEKPGDLEALAAEVRSGKCVLSETKGGTIQRIVAVMALHLKRGDTLLAELGELKCMTIKPSCRLPGSKQLNFEPAEDTLRRELFSTYAPLRDGMQMKHTEYSEMVGRSESFGLTSVYQKTTQFAVMDALHPLPLLPTAEAKNGNRGHQYSKTPVFMLMQQGKIKLHAWLQADVFKHLSSPQGKNELHDWCDDLVADEESARNQLAWTSEKFLMQKKSITKTLCNSLLYDIRSKFEGSRRQDTEKQPEKPPEKRNSSRPSRIRTMTTHGMLTGF